MEKHICILALFLGVITSQTGASVLNTENNRFPELVEFSEIRNGQCGGTIELDSGTLSYPEEGVEIKPNELCIWTIHLRTMDGWRFNFTDLDLPGNNPGCSGAAVTIYGLSNLIPSDSPERYRFCNENDNGGYHFLTGNIATVVFYTGSNFAVNSTRRGFHLHWEGSRFQTVPTLHSSSYSSTPTGAVWYPVQGEYPPNAGMTWLVNGGGIYNAPSLIVDIMSVDFESCSLSDPCLCDALIIYDIADNGDLHEVDRFCGERNGTTILENVSSDFVAAFYSDSVDTPGSGLGFKLDWRQIILSTTTSEAPESTTEFPGPVITTCGGVIEADSGTIDYFSNELYPNSAKCIWTIRTSPRMTQIELTKFPTEFEVPYDFISAHSIISGVGQVVTLQLGYTSNDLERVNMLGTVMLLKFKSDSSIQRRGFRLQFRALGDASPVAYHHDESTALQSGSIAYPSEGSYQNHELSTFVITNNNSNQGYIPLTVNSYNFESSAGCFYDGLTVYSVENYVLRQMGRWCGQSTGEPANYSANAYVLVLYSDGSIQRTGFNVSWGTQNLLL